MENSKDVVKKDADVVKEIKSIEKLPVVESIIEVPLAKTIVDDINVGSSEKTLDVVNIEDAKTKVSDIKVFGNGDLFQLICKASSDEQGWMKSTKAMEIAGVGCVVQVTTQQRNSDYTNSIAEAITFVPGVRIDTDGNGNKYLCKI